MDYEARREGSLDQPFKDPSPGSLWELTLDPKRLRHITRRTGIYQALEDPAGRISFYPLQGKDEWRIGFAGTSCFISGEELHANLG